MPVALQPSPPPSTVLDTGAGERGPGGSLKLDTDPSPPSPGLLVLALGGNALLPRRSAGRLEDQWRAARAAAEHVARLATEGRPLLVVHGNGPQVGLELQRAALTEASLPGLTVDMAVAGTQGSLGYCLARALADALAARGIQRPVVALVTQVLVDDDDPAFNRPEKPIGPWLSAAEAAAARRQRGWTVAAVGPEPRGWRRLVASPLPRRVLELEAIRALLAGGALVVAGGGGGVPLRRAAGRLEGVAAVVDKDQTAALLAQALGAAGLLIATDVKGVALHYGQPDETWLPRLDLAQAEALLAAGGLGAGSMGPKVEAALAVARGGGRALICHLEAIDEAWTGRAGTEIGGAADCEEEQARSDGTPMRTVLG